MRQREHAVGWIAAGLIAATSGLSASAQAQSPVSNWPNSPVRHPLRAAAPVATPTFSANLRGSYVTAGNTLLTCPTNSLARRLRAKSEPASGGRAVYRLGQQRPGHEVRQRRSPGRALRFQHGHVDGAERRTRRARPICTGGQISHAVSRTTRRPARREAKTRAPKHEPNCLDKEGPPWLRTGRGRTRRWTRPAPGTRRQVAGGSRAGTRSRGQPSRLRLPGASRRHDGDQPRGRCQAPADRPGSKQV